jgi:hypothetical protein
VSPPDATTASASTPAMVPVSRSTVDTARFPASPATMARTGTAIDPPPPMVADDVDSKVAPVASCHCVPLAMTVAAVPVAVILPVDFAAGIRLRCHVFACDRMPSPVAVLGMD